MNLEDTELSLPLVAASALGLARLRGYSGSADSQYSSFARAAPVIKNFNWQPTRTLKDKIYDGIISFEADNASSPVVGAELEFGSDRS